MKDFKELERLEKLSKEMSEESSVPKQKSKLPFIIIGTVIIIAIIVGIFLISNGKNKQEESKPDTMYEDSQEIVISDDYDGNDESGVVDAANGDNQQITDMLETYDELLKSGSNTNDLYVTGDISVGKDKDIKPGVYDMTFVGGSLNGYINNPDFGLVFYGENNEVARLILSEGTVLESSEVSKVKFSAVKKSKVLSEFGQGQYLVGKDIEEGTYIVGTNGSLSDGGWWDISIYSPEGLGSYNMKSNQQFDAGNNDIAIALKEGDILSLCCDRWECIGNLVLTEK